jgi:hypothetical protein
LANKNIVKNAGYRSFSNCFIAFNQIHYKANQHYSRKNPNLPVLARFFDFGIAVRRREDLGPPDQIVVAYRGVVSEDEDKQHESDLARGRRTIRVDFRT